MEHNQANSFVKNLSHPQEKSLSFNVASLNEQFNNSTPQEILSWCIKNIDSGLVITTSFSTSVIVNMLYRELAPKQPIPVLFLDTLHHFPETLEAAEEASHFYELDLRVYRTTTASTREEFAQVHGSNLWERDIDRFHYLTKVEPLQRALNEMNVSAWITGRRRNQSDIRQEMSVFERESQGRLKINPLANWTGEDVWQYIQEHQVPYNSLHDKGYTSIGDEPLTTPVEEGETERAGRWRGSKKCECGIHLW